MFKIDKSDKTTIKCTRGDKGNIILKKKLREDGTIEPFYKDDIVIFTVKNNFADSEPLLRKEIKVLEDCESLKISFSKEDTTIGDLIATPVKYQYEISINEDLTILGYDESGPKIFQLYPEGSNDKWLKQKL